MTSPARRLLLVHAHPDDETITCGATMARYAAEGAGVTLVTCTLGEEGEILVPELAHLASDRADRLGAHRIRELRAATFVLGVGDLRFLGGPGRWRDSGMMGSASNDRSDCFWRADVAEAAAALVAVIREVRPQVVVTYDPQGGYGHPDHIQAHRVTMRAVDEAAGPGRPDLGPAWRVDKVYWPCVPESVARESARRLREAGGAHGFTVPDPRDDAFVVPDPEVTAAVDAADHVEAKRAALQAHATQVTVDGPFFALSNTVGQVVGGTEYYRLARGTPGGARDGLGRETDLFSGIG